MNGIIKRETLYSKKKKYKGRKNYVCSKCLNNSFELIKDQTDNNKLIIVCSNCQSISNDDCYLNKDSKPSSLLMSLEVRK